MSRGTPQGVARTERRRAHPLQGSNDLATHRQVPTDQIEERP
ncbi:hypothetical protein [Azospirillum doebereinerae]